MRAMESDFFAPPTPRPIAHRGGGGLFPENTLAAFEASAALGAPYAELDVHATREPARCRRYSTVTDFARFRG